MSDNNLNPASKEYQQDLKPNRFKWLSLFVMVLALAIVVIDGTVLNVSQKYVITDLNTDLQTIQWAFTSYSLVLAALTILGGRLGDIFGRKRTFVLGAIIFAIGSAMTAFAKDATMLIWGWSIVEGIGAALMIPASSALLVSNFEGKERGIAFGIYGATAGAASSFGPILGGYFATNIGWRWAFGINVVIAAILCLGTIIVRDLKTDFKKKPYLDLFGVFLSSVGLVSIMYGVIESSKYGWWSAKKAWEIFGSKLDLVGVSVSFWSILLGILFLIGFIFWEFKVEKMGKEPLIRLEIFANRQFSFGVVTMATMFSGFSGLITYGVVFYFLNVKGMNAFEAGLTLIPFSLATFFVAPISSRIADKIGQKRLVQIGLLTNTIGIFMIYNVMRYEATVNDFLPAFIVSGIGFGLIMAQLNNIILSSVKVSEAGVASGINGTIREVGRAFGVALIGAAFISTLNTVAKDNIQNNQNLSVAAKAQVVKALDDGSQKIGSDTSKNDAQILQEAKSRGYKLNTELLQKSYLLDYKENNKQISESINRAITDSSKHSLLYSLGFSFVALAVSFWLSSNKKLAGDQVTQAAIGK
jgi:EmrB/QacA subfamily drug resistance transporter